MISEGITRYIPNTLSFWEALTDKDPYIGVSEIVPTDEVKYIHDNYRRLVSDGYEAFDPTNRDLDNYIDEYSRGLILGINPTADYSSKMQAKLFFDSMISLINNGELDSSLLYPKIYDLEKPEEFTSKAKVFFSEVEEKGSEVFEYAEKTQGTIKTALIATAVVAGSIAIIKLK